MKYTKINFNRVNMNMKSLLIYCFLLGSVVLGHSATTLRTIQYDPTTSNTVPTNLTIRARSLTINPDATFPGSLTLYGTNGNGATMQAANSNSVTVTNVVGLLHKASAAVIVLDCNDGNTFQITNQLGQATSLIVTNLAQGQIITISGDADGTSRVVTIIPKLGYLVRDFDTFGVAAAANKAITATNGNTFEISIAAKWSFGTNFADTITRQAKY